MTRRLNRAQEIAEVLTPRPGVVRQAGTRHEDLLVSVARELERALARRRKLRRELRAADATIKDRKLALRRLIAETANRGQEEL